MHCIEKSTCDVVGTFRRLPQAFGALIVTRRPGNFVLLPPPLVTPLFAILVNALSLCSLRLMTVAKMYSKKIFFSACLQLCCSASCLCLCYSRCRYMSRILWTMTCFHCVVRPCISQGRMTRRPCGQSPPPDISFFQILNKNVCLCQRTLTIRERGFMNEDK